VRPSARPLGWMFAIEAELMGASTGLGFLMTDGEMTGRLSVINGLSFSLQSPAKSRTPYWSRRSPSDGLDENSAIFNVSVRPVCTQCTRRFYFSFPFVRALGIYFHHQPALL
jgi:hypothetical protein